MQRLGAVAAPVHRHGERVDLVPRATEDDGRNGGLDVQEPAQGGRLVAARDDVEHLVGRTRSERDPSVPHAHVVLHVAGAAGTVGGRMPWA